MDEDESGIKFVNCVGSDIDLWRKGPNESNFELETCLLYDEPIYHADEVEENTTWKFVCHITKRYLYGNGQREFCYQKHECPPINIEIKLPLYTLQELCTYTVATRMYHNNSCTAINDFHFPESLKLNVRSCLEYLEIMCEHDDYTSDWTTYHEEEV